MAENEPVIVRQTAKSFCPAWRMRGMPATVAASVYILWMLLLYDLASDLWSLFYLATMSNQQTEFHVSRPAVMWMAFAAFVDIAAYFLFYFILIRKIAAGCKWARTLYLVFFMIGLVLPVMLLMTIKSSFIHHLLLKSATLHFKDAVYDGLTVFALYLLFVPRSRGWFQPKHNPSIAA